MFSTIFKKTSFAPALTVLAGTLAAVPGMQAADLRGPTTVIVVTPMYESGQPAVTDLLKEIETTAVELSSNSDQLESLTRSNVSRAGYVSSLGRVRQQINRSGEQLAQLQRLRSIASPLQQEAIDRITPLVRQLAANTGSAINHVNKAPQQLYSTDYKNTLQAIAADAHQMKNNISDFINLAEAQQKVDALQAKLS